MNKIIKTFGINNAKAHAFREYLNRNHISFSMYPMENYWHFDCLMIAEEYGKAENYCDRLFNRTPKEQTTENNPVIIIEVTRYIIL